MAETEDRSLPPSATKLRRARRDGKVAHARDVVALAIVPVLLWLVLRWRSIETELKSMLVTVFTQEFAVDTDYLLHTVAPMIFSQIVWLGAPLVIFAALVGVLLSVVDTQGFLFSAKPIAPDFNRINPGDGLKRIFSARTVTEAGFSLIKLAVFVGCVALVLTGAMGALRRLQVCGLPCVPQVVGVTILPLIIAAVAVFAAAALIDFVLSRNLFRLEMRMSLTEMKHENKDSYGNPEQKRRRRDEGRAALTGPKRLGIAASTLVIDGPDGIVGIRYVPSEIRAPVVVAKSRGAAAADMRLSAQALDLKIMRNPELLRVLLERGLVGALIPAESFRDVANEIVNAEKQ
jgi:type III secretion protein U